MEETVILVSKNDEAIGTMEKMQAHRQGVLHRAFSVFIFDSKGRMLLQQRSAQKYHGALLWSNTCCSHPYPNEDVAAGAERRLQQEMGFTTPLTKIFEFTYRAPVENNLIEHEYDHVFAGEYEGPVHINPAEVAGYKYDSMPDIKQAIQKQPQQFTAWFKLAFPTIETWWQQHYQPITI